MEVRELMLIGFMEQIHAMIIDEELRRKRQTDQQMKLG